MAFAQALPCPCPGKELLPKSPGLGLNGASGGCRPGPPTPCPPRSATRRAAPDRAFTCSAAARLNVPARLSRPFHAPLGQRHLARRPAPRLPVAIAPPGSSLRWSQFPGGRPGLHRLRPQRLCARGAPRPAGCPPRVRRAKNTGGRRRRPRETRLRRVAGGGTDRVEDTQARWTRRGGGEEGGVTWAGPHVSEA